MYKKRRKKSTFCFLSAKGDEGQSLTDMSAKKSIFFYWGPPFPEQLFAMGSFIRRTNMCPCLIDHKILKSGKIKNIHWEWRVGEGGGEEKAWGIHMNVFIGRTTAIQSPFTPLDFFLSLIFCFFFFWLWTICILSFCKNVRLSLLSAFTPPPFF